MSAARGSSILIRLFRKITFETAQNTVTLDMSNRIIKSLDCSKIISIFCILEVDWAVPVCVFTISVITLFVVFNESFQKALVDKSVCVINIAHLIVLPSTKNPLFDAYFNRVTALLTVIFFPCYESIFGTRRTLCIEIFVCYAGIFESLCTLCIDICIFRVRINISDNALIGFRRSYLLFLFPFLYKTKKLNSF